MELSSQLLAQKYCFALTSLSNTQIQFEELNQAESSYQWILEKLRVKAKEAINSFTD